MSASSGASYRSSVSFLAISLSFPIFYSMLTDCRRWPYKFVHALLRILLEAGNLNLQAHTPAESVTERDESGWITVKTARGSVRTKAVVHATNRWASHLLPEFGNIIFGNRATLASIKAPEGFIKHTGAQHWDSVVNVCGPQSSTMRKWLTVPELSSPTSATI